MLLPLAAPLDPLPLAVCFWTTADEASSMAHAVCFSIPSRSTTCLSVRPLSLLSCVANGSHDTLSSTWGAVDAAAAAVAVVGTLAALAFCFDIGTTKHEAIIFVLPQVKEHARQRMQQVLAEFALLDSVVARAEMSRAGPPRDPGAPCIVGFVLRLLSTL